MNTAKQWITVIHEQEESRMNQKTKEEIARKGGEARAGKKEDQEQRGGQRSHLSDEDQASSNLSH